MCMANLSDSQSSESTATDGTSTKPKPKLRLQTGKTTRLSLNQWSHNIKLTHYKVSSLTARVEVFRSTLNQSHQVVTQLQQGGFEDIKVKEPSLKLDEQYEISTLEIAIDEGVR